MRPSGHVGVVGGSGFVGSHVVARGRGLEFDVTPIPVDHVSGSWAQSPSAAAAAWRRSNSEALTGLCSRMEPFDVVINAAGLAQPGSRDRHALFAANTLLPAILAHAAHVAGVRRFVHISSAAVQGRLDPLDETTRHAPLTPYSRSKAAAEQFLLDGGGGHVPPEVIVYRATSVQAAGQTSTQLFGRLVARLPAVPVTGTGDQPVPVCLIQNLVAGILFAATMPLPSPVILQPSEHISANRLLEDFGARRIVHIPPKVSGLALGGLHRVTASFPSLSSRLRWLDLLLLGQDIHAEALASAGFLPPAGQAEWAELARRGSDRPRARWVGW